MGALYLYAGQMIAIGPFNFNASRLLIVVGFLRIVLKGERIREGNSLDKFVIFWALCAVLSSVFHTPITAALVSRLGFVCDHLGIYLLMRTFIQGEDDLIRVGKMVIVLLIPLAVAMAIEHVTNNNVFGIVGGDVPEVRAGKVRAQGPFRHAILAGTAGAVCLPLAIFYWSRNRKLALAGIAASTAIVLASASSGPIMTAAFALSAMALWKFRNQMQMIRWAGILAIVALALMMNAPVYYLFSYIDLTGSSTGWHRARLIESTIEHFHEWWFAGTDYTRHWMPTGIGANENHTDITNVYIMMGVIGGLPLMLLFIGTLVSAFRALGATLRRLNVSHSEDQFLVWTIGAILFGNAMTFLSVNYFDQMIMLYYLALAGAASLQAGFASHVSEATPREDTGIPPAAPLCETISYRL